MKTFPWKSLPRFMPDPSPSSQYLNSAFSLVELLAVMSISSLLAGLSIGNITSLSATGRLNQSLEQVTRSAILARQTSMGTGHPVALVVSRTPDEPGVILLRGAPGPSNTFQWTPAGAWERLPEQIAL